MRDEYAPEVERDAEGKAVRLWFVRRPYDPAERVLVAEPAIPESVCHHCDGTFRPRRPHQVYCSDRCRTAAFKTRQSMIDFTPAASAHGHAVRTRATKAQRILAILRAGPASSYQLAQVTHRFGARLLELRRAGHAIEREDHVEGGREWSTYRLR